MGDNHQHQRVGRIICTPAEVQGALSHPLATGSACQCSRKSLSHDMASRSLQIGKEGRAMARRPGALHFRYAAVLRERWCLNEN